jgi:hypothetical protein
LNAWRREKTRPAIGNAQPATLLLIAHCALPVYYQSSFLAAGFAGVVPVVFFSLAGRDLPKEPLNVFPFFVFLSPLPIEKF